MVVSEKKKKEKKEKLWDKKVFTKVFLISVLICTVVFTTGFTLGEHFLDYGFMKKTGDTDSDKSKTAENMNILIKGSGIFAREYRTSKRVNILVMGTTDEGLADTVMLMSFDPKTKRFDEISIPRDTYYYREGKSGGFLKFNSIFHDGPEAVAEAVHEVLVGIPINYYAVVDYDGVANIVDSMGGVPMDVPIDMHYLSAEQNLIIDINAGQQVLDGNHAVQYLRFRKGYANGDLGRVEAQQEFVKNAAKEALGLSLPSVAKSVVENVDSDITLRALLYLAKKAKGMSFDNVDTHTIPGTGGGIGGLSFFIRGDDTEIDAMIREFYGDPAKAKPAEDAKDGDEAASADSKAAAE
ncbi:MAG: LCP family protein [Clostridiales Family XIII bacterium]|jgi:LCP family protein required for cell wall assembly|nr:LCP family protein [Clostridiales Family XIII bacterium]